MLPNMRNMVHHSAHNVTAIVLAARMRRIVHEQRDIARKTHEVNSKLARLAVSCLPRNPLHLHALIRANRWGNVLWRRRLWRHTLPIPSAWRLVDLLDL